MSTSNINMQQGEEVSELPSPYTSFPDTSASFVMTIRNFFELIGANLHKVMGSSDSDKHLELLRVTAKPTQPILRSYAEYVTLVTGNGRENKSKSEVFESSKKIHDFLWLIVDHLLYDMYDQCAEMNKRKLLQYGDDARDRATAEVLIYILGRIASAKVWMFPVYFIEHLKSVISLLVGYEEQNVDLGISKNIPFLVKAKRELTAIDVYHRKVWQSLCQLLPIGDLSLIPDSPSVVARDLFDISLSLFLDISSENGDAYALIAFKQLKGLMDERIAAYASMSRIALVGKLRCNLNNNEHVQKAVANQIVAYVSNITDNTSVMFKEQLASRAIVQMFGNVSRSGMDPQTQPGFLKRFENIDSWDSKTLQAMAYDQASLDVEEAMLSPELCACQHPRGGKSLSAFMATKCIQDFMCGVAPLVALVRIAFDMLVDETPSSSSYLGIDGVEADFEKEIGPDGEEMRLPIESGCVAHNLLFAVNASTEDTVGPLPLPSIEDIHKASEQDIELDKSVEDFMAFLDLVQYNHYVSLQDKDLGQEGRLILWKRIFLYGALVTTMRFPQHKSTLHWNKLFSKMLARKPQTRPVMATNESDALDLAETVDANGAHNIAFFIDGLRRFMDLLFCSELDGNLSDSAKQYRTEHLVWLLQAPNQFLALFGVDRNLATVLLTNGKLDSPNDVCFFHLRALIATFSQSMSLGEMKNIFGAQTSITNITIISKILSTYRQQYDDDAVINEHEMFSPHKLKHFLYHDGLFLDEYSEDDVASAMEVLTNALQTNERVQTSVLKKARLYCNLVNANKSIVSHLNARSVHMHNYSFQDVLRFVLKAILLFTTTNLQAIDQICEGMPLGPFILMFFSRQASIARKFEAQGYSRDKDIEEAACAMRQR